MTLSPQHRADIQGLRAVAVIAVIAGHLFPNAIKGGFVGVDIFFVISGFVITQQLAKLHAKSPQTFLRDFYSRRIKRIVPAALLVTISTIVATSYFLGPVAANGAKLDGGWVSIFLGNFHFQEVAIDYFSAGTRTSPLQHYWSLSIEEQFYLIWPALFLLLMLKVRNKLTQLCVIGFIIVLSLSTALYKAEISAQPIFFMSSTRVWELACGAALALSAKSIRFPKLLTYLCLSVFIVSSLFIEPTMQWPSLQTLPVIIATLLLLAHNFRIAPNRLLQNRVLVYLGDISYVLYLWHWPIFTIYRAYVTTYGPTEKIYTILATVALSVATHHFIENPIRFSKQVSPVLSISIGVSAIAATSGLLFISYQG